MEHSQEYFDTFGRVDDVRFVHEICTYEAEDNYSNRIIIAVEEEKNGGHAILLQILNDDPDEEAGWPKSKVVFNSVSPKEGGATEEAVIEKAETLFNNWR